MNKNPWFEFAFKYVKRLFSFWQTKSRTQVGIKWAVFIVHGMVILSLCVHHFFSGETKRSHIVVRTIRAPIVTATRTSPSIAAAEPKLSPKPKNTPVKKRAPETKKEVKKTAEKVIQPVQEKPSQITSVLKETPSINEEKGDTALLKEIQEQFAELEKPKASLAKVVPLSVPSVSERLQIVSAETETSQGDALYGDLLVAYLQSMLSLPEQGVVKIELEVDGLGVLVRCDVVEAQSKKNSDFLKKQLPELKLPCFNGKPNEVFVCTILFKNM